MNGRVTAVLVGTFIALVGATVWVPVRVHYNFHPDAPGADAKLVSVRAARERRPPGSRARRECEVMLDAATTGEPQALDPEWPPRYRAVWRPWARYSQPGTPYSWREVPWLQLVLAEQALILLHGGGLLTLVVRWERRRRAASAA